MKQLYGPTQQWLRRGFVILTVLSLVTVLFFTGRDRASQAEAAPIFSGAVLPASPTAEPTKSLPTLKLGTMPVAQAIALFQTDIDKLNSEVAALQTQNGKLLAQNVQLQAQVTAQDAILQAQINTIQKSLQPTPRPPGSLLPGAISWYSLKNGGSSYDNLLIQVFQNPTQETEKPKL
jgi:hypothetical protein